MERAGPIVAARVAAVNLAAILVPVTSSVLLFDDQRGAGRKRAALIEAELNLEVHYVWDVEHAVTVLKKQVFEVIVLDYLDLSGWGDARCGLDVVRRGIPESPNVDTPVIIYSLLTVPADETTELRKHCNLAAVKNQLMVDKTIVALVAEVLGLPPVEVDLRPTVSARTTAVAKVLEWSPDAMFSRLVVPSWRADKEVVVDRAWWRRQPSDVLSSFEDRVDGIKPENPMLVRVEYDPEAEDAYTLNLAIIERIGLSSRFRSQLAWNEPASVIDPEAPVDTPAGRRHKKKAADEATRSEWKAIHEELKELYETDADDGNPD